jgi:hypothetical protein
VLTHVVDEPLRIRWISDGDECVAKVGAPLRWRRRATERARRAGMWKQGRTVIAIEERSGVWSVLLDPDEPGDTWANPITCGGNVKVDDAAGGDRG